MKTFWAVSSFVFVFSLLIFSFLFEENLDHVFNKEHSYTSRTAADGKTSTPQWCTLAAIKLILAKFWSAHFACCFSSWSLI